MINLSRLAMYDRGAASNRSYIMGLKRMTPPKKSEPPDGPQSIATWRPLRPARNRKAQRKP